MLVITAFQAQRLLLKMCAHKDRIVPLDMELLSYARPGDSARQLDCRHQRALASAVLVTSALQAQRFRLKLPAQLEGMVQQQACPHQLVRAHATPVITVLQAQRARHKLPAQQERLVQQLD